MKTRDALLMSKASLTSESPYAGDIVCERMNSMRCNLENLSKTFAPSLTTRPTWQEVERRPRQTPSSTRRLATIVLSVRVKSSSDRPCHDFVACATSFREPASLVESRSGCSRCLIKKLKVTHDLHLASSFPSGCLTCSLFRQ